MAFARSSSLGIVMFVGTRSDGDRIYEVFSYEDQGHDNWFLATQAGSSFLEADLMGGIAILHESVTREEWAGSPSVVKVAGRTQDEDVPIAIEVNGMTFETTSQRRGFFAFITTFDKSPMKFPPIQVRLKSN